MFPDWSNHTSLAVRFYSFKLFNFNFIYLFSFNRSQSGPPSDYTTHPHALHHLHLALLHICVQSHSTANPPYCQHLWLGSSHVPSCTDYGFWLHYLHLASASNTASLWSTEWTNPDKLNYPIQTKHLIQFQQTISIN